MSRFKFTYANVVVDDLPVSASSWRDGLCGQPARKNSVGTKQLKTGAVRRQKLSPASKATLTGP